MAVIYEGATEEIRKVVHHHAVLRRGMERRSGALCEAVADRDQGAGPSASPPSSPDCCWSPCSRAASGTGGLPGPGRVRLAFSGAVVSR